MSLVVVRAFGLVTVQDTGRPGHMHEALSPGGALSPALLAAANHRVRNALDAPAVEICGQLTVRADRDVVAATDRETRTLTAGDTWTITSEPARVTYLALRGGIEAPLVLGGRGTMLSAGIGKRLGKDDVIAAAASPEVAHEHVDAPASDEPIRIIAGPDPEAFAPNALDLLVSSPYRISTASDRIGTRLEGASIPRLPGERVSSPMVSGSFEVPPDGQPIVLGPENPTCGGYPILAIISHADLGRFFSLRLGGTVRFRI
jgi:allophanate hydrolase subunit 2